MTCISCSISCYGSLLSFWAFFMPGGLYSRPRVRSRFDKAFLQLCPIHPRHFVRVRAAFYISSPLAFSVLELANEKRQRACLDYAAGGAVLLVPAVGQRPLPARKCHIKHTRLFSLSTQRSWLRGSISEQSSLSVVHQHHQSAPSSPSQTSVGHLHHHGHSHNLQGGEKRVGGVRE